MLFPIITTFFLIAASPAFADAESMRSAYESKQFVEQQKELLWDKYMEEAIETQSKAEALRETVTDAFDTTEEIIGNAEAFNTDERRQQMFKKGTIVGGISNETFAKAEEIRRNQLELEKDDQLYIFVSRSMPMELIRSYALDAAYSGAVVVARGIPDDEKLADYLRSEFMQQIKPGGAGSMVQIDPRLFDAFKVDLVPSIVYTNKNLYNLCNEGLSSSTSCKPIHEEDYFKVSGSVTTKYALEQFVMNGAEGASRFLKHIMGEHTSDEDDPRLVAALDEEKYRELVTSINSELLDGKKTDLVESQIINTPFGQVRAPVGVSQILKNIGTMEVVRD